MKIINTKLESVEKAIGVQIEKAKEYRKSKYLMEHRIDAGLLIYNLITRQLILLTEEEAKIFNKVDTSTKLGKQLIEDWYFVEIDFDDYLLYKQTENLMRILAYRVKNPKIEHYDILTTTDCNARCFYCFELQNKRRFMSEQTANDVAEYIIKTCSDTNMKITWFGGEPLYNIKVIDIISNRLNNANKKFVAEMASNAYLFDDEIIKRAKENWHLGNVQITIDGTEDIYNKTKAYIYKNVGSPYLKVIGNIEKLLKSGISVNIRLNIDMHNDADIENLLEELIAKFGCYKGLLHIYVSPLFDNCGKTAVERTDEIKLHIFNTMKRLYDRIFEVGLNFDYSLYSYRFYTICMANNDRANVILPDGELGKCEHYLDDMYFGSIYSDKFDNNVIEFFKKTEDNSDFCVECDMRPICRKLVSCTHTKRQCDELDRKFIKKNLKDEMYGDYLRSIKSENE